MGLLRFNTVVRQTSTQQRRRTVDGFETIVGAFAGTCTTLCNVPQVWKSWTTGETGDISFKMLLLLAGGLVLWMVYGTVKADAIIVSANTVSLGLVLVLLYFKTHGKRTEGKQGEHDDLRGA